MRITDAILICTALLVGGCVSGNKGVEVNIPKSNKSTTAENIEAGTKAITELGGMLFHKESE